jgi:hypothetical protein
MGGEGVAAEAVVAGRVMAAPRTRADLDVGGTSVVSCDDRPDSQRQSVGANAATGWVAGVNGM